MSDLVLRRATDADHEPVGALTVAAYAEFTDGPEDGYLDQLRDAARRMSILRSRTWRAGTSRRRR